MLNVLKKSWNDAFSRKKMILSKMVDGSEEIYTVPEGGRAWMLQNFCKIASKRNRGSIYIVARDGLPEVNDRTTERSLSDLLVSGCEICVLTGPEGASAASINIKRFNAASSREGVQLCLMEKDPPLFFCLLQNGRESCIYYEPDLSKDRCRDGSIKGYATALCDEQYLKKFIEYVDRNKPCGPTRQEGTCALSSRDMANANALGM